ncbi:MAG: hypothetical protein K0S66_203 [Sphingomonas sp.]|jgi:hypothetical protein|nr:hypothetical protein [Sphingomonas sp.]
MTHVLSARERKLLQHLELDDEVYQIRGKLPVGTGEITLDRLTKLGLLETGPGRFGEIGWRLTEDGWRCMYGKPKSELGAEGAPHHPLKVWSWPPTLTAPRVPARSGPRLKTVTPRLSELAPRLSPLRKR